MPKVSLIAATADQTAVAIVVDTNEAVHLWKILLDMERSLCPAERAFRLHMTDLLFDALGIANLAGSLLGVSREDIIDKCRGLQGY